MIGKKEKIILSIFLGVIVITMALFSFEKFPQGKIAFGVKIANINVGGKAPKEVESIIKNKVDEFNEKTILLILKTNEDKKYGAAIKINQLKPKYQISTTVKEAFSLGKEKSFLKNLKEKLMALLGKRNVPLKIEISEEELDNFLTLKFGKFENPPINSEVIFNEKTLKFTI